MKDIIKVVEDLWDDPERQREREKLLAEMEERGEVERIDDVLLIQAQQIENENWYLDRFL